MDGITVDIQDVFSFAGGWQVLGIVLAALAAAGYIAAVVFLSGNRHKEQRAVHKSIETIKRKYLAKITEVRQDVISGKIDSRRGFAKVSIITRNFVKAAVGIDVQNYTLDEIAALRMNSLTMLVSHCYEPEFARESPKLNSDEFTATINMAEDIISRWS